MKNYQRNSIYDKYFERVEEMIESLPSLEERFMQIEEVAEEYFQETGEQLPAILLEGLELGTCKKPIQIIEGTKLHLKNSLFFLNIKCIEEIEKEL